MGLIFLMSSINPTMEIGNEIKLIKFPLIKLINVVKKVKIIPPLVGVGFT